MAKSNKTSTPKVSPFSQSVWQDPSDNTRWSWSVHRGTQIHKQGHAISYEEANTQCGAAMTSMLKQSNQ